MYSIAQLDFTDVILIFIFFVFLPVKEKLTADPESEIATTSLRVSLLCPVNTPLYCLIKSFCYCN